MLLFTIIHSHNTQSWLITIATTCWTRTSETYHSRPSSKPTSPLRHMNSKQFHPALFRILDRTRPWMQFFNLNMQFQTRRKPSRLYFTKSTSLLYLTQELPHQTKARSTQLETKKKYLQLHLSRSQFRTSTSDRFRTTCWEPNHWQKKR